MKKETKEKIIIFIVAIGIIFAIWFVYLTSSSSGSFHVTFGIFTIIYIIGMIFVMLYFINHILKYHSIVGQ